MRKEGRPIPNSISMFRRSCCRASWRRNTDLADQHRSCERRAGERTCLDVAVTAARRLGGLGFVNFRDSNSALEVLRREPVSYAPSSGYIAALQQVKSWATSTTDSCGAQQLRETVESAGAISSADLNCRSIEDYAVLLTPQKNASGLGTMPVTSLRQA